MEVLNEEKVWCDVAGYETTESYCASCNECKVLAEEQAAADRFRSELVGNCD